MKKILACLVVITLLFTGCNLATQKIDGVQINLSDSKITTPIFVAACTQDDLAPADKTIELAKKCKTATYKTYNCGHFQIYCNELFE